MTQRVHELVGDLEVVALVYAPIAFDQARIYRVTRLRRRRLVGDEIELGEPRDRTGLPAREHGFHLSVAERIGVLVVARAGAPTRPHVDGGQTDPVVRP